MYNNKVLAISALALFLSAVVLFYLYNFFFHSEIENSNLQGTSLIFFNPDEEKDLLKKYLKNIDLPQTNKEFLIKSLNIKDINSIEIVSKRKNKQYNFNNILVNKFTALTNTNLQFSYLEILNKDSVKISKNIFFINGHSGSAEEVFGIIKGVTSDPIIENLLKDDVRIIYMFQYDSYQDDIYLNSILIEASRAGVTLNGLEQLKLTSLLKEYKGKKIIFGFSHGSWISLLNSVFNPVDTIILVDWMVDTDAIAPNFPNYLYDYDGALDIVYDYQSLLKLSKSSKIIIMLGNKSPYTNKSNIKLFEKLSFLFDKIEFHIYKGDHYLTKNLASDISKFY